MLFYNNILIKYDNLLVSYKLCNISTFISIDSFNFIKLHKRITQ